MEEFDFKAFQAKVVEQLRSGEPLLGKGGAFAPLLESILNAALEGEMDSHLTSESRSSGNRRNGHMPKEIQTPVGPVGILTPRDRNGSFDPQTVKKRETFIADNMADKIISLYALGNSTREISNWVEDNLGQSLSADTISNITDRIMPELESWRIRPLEDVYPIVWMDAIHYKVMDDKNRPQTRAIYNVLGINKEGYKELLGMYVSKSEGANFWLSVLTDLNNRGVKDILIACIDQLRGFSDAVLAVFPEATVQHCIIHQIRNSMKYVASKNQKEFMGDLKRVYQAMTKTEAEMALDKLEEKWGELYPIVIKSWRDNWTTLSAYFQFTEPIRRLIYTTNTVEGYHRQVRKVTKSKGVFTNDKALEKLVYLAYRNIVKKWNKPISNWAKTAQQLAIIYPERLHLF